jgi:hypothetical protein
LHKILSAKKEGYLYRVTVQGKDGIYDTHMSRYHLTQRKLEERFHFEFGVPEEIIHEYREVTQKLCAKRRR